VVLYAIGAPEGIRTP